MSIRDFGLLAILLYSCLHSIVAVREENEMGTTRDQLSAAKNLLDDIDHYLNTIQSSLCHQHHVSADSPLCVSTSGDNGDFTAHLKRSSIPIPDASLRLLQEIQQKKHGLEALKRIVAQLDASLITEQTKRACQYNLGAHCATQEARSRAHWHHLLQGVGSPGRKRRDVIAVDRQRLQKLVRSALTDK